MFSSTPALRYALFALALILLPSLTFAAASDAWGPEDLFWMLPLSLLIFAGVNSIPFLICMLFMIFVRKVAQTAKKWWQCFGVFLVVSLISGVIINYGLFYAPLEELPDFVLIIFSLLTSLVTYIASFYTAYRLTK